ncbi:MAG: hypothetical protein QOK27_2804 [Gemmatimonadales bacterium]|nr:hypothetical protein [Gemmatimonadales bacterium]
MVMPFFEREWAGRTDIATIQGLSGASISPSSTAPLSLWREYAASQGWVAGYIQLATSVELGERVPGAELVISNWVFLLDLTKGDVLDSASTIVRRKVRKAVKLGAVLVDDRSVLTERMKLLYPLAMERVGAPSRYRFSAQTLERWALDPSSIVLGARVGDDIEAVSVFSVAGRGAEYNINASTECGRDLTAWLIWNAASRLRERGIAELNLGGGVSPGDGVYRFKERFNGASKPVRAVCQIYDRASYDELCGHADAAASQGWFPAYRASRS